MYLLVAQEKRGLLCVVFVMTISFKILSKASFLNLYAILLLVLMVFIGIFRESKTALNMNLPTKMVGVYSPGNAVKPYFGANMSIGFFNLSDLSSPQQIAKFLKQSKHERTIPIISLEPFRFSLPLADSMSLHQQYESAQALFILSQIKSIFESRSSPIIVRLAHEMDVPNQYPWFFSNPNDYQRFYRYIFQLIDSKTNYPLVWLWSPQGRDNAAKYWPGNDVVDLIGISVFSSTLWSSDQCPESFSSIVNSKRWLASYYRRPLFAAEVGVSALPKCQSKWLLEATNWIRRNPDILLGFIYYQAEQPEFMIESTGRHDWRVDQHSLLKAINSMSPSLF